MEKPITLIGVDLGQARDWTAISVIERVAVKTGRRVQEEYWEPRLETYMTRPAEEKALEYRVRHLERPPLGTPYPDVVARIVELVKRIGGEPVLAVDATGVGRPVTDMLWQRLEEEIRGTRIYVTPCPVTITGGDSVTRAEGGGWRVPKRDLISAALVLLQNGRLKVAEALTLRETLVKELLAFRVKISISTGHDSYEAWREGDHDDLVLSVALACWAGERFLRKPKLAKVYSF
jgi:hypothetical protein